MIVSIMLFFFTDSSFSAKLDPSKISRYAVYIVLQDRIGNLEKELKSMKDKLLEETNIKSLRWQNEERQQVSERMHEQWQLGQIQGPGCVHYLWICS